MESNAVSNTNWKEIGITAGIVLVVGFVATLGAIYASRGIDKALAKKSSSKEKSDSEKKA
ncbi:MAG: hypothetical protein EPN85_05735 [Bacteroidetes bacterium]|nr:MAG: hypothetical protein EPN85_05735 [Bacteroidota bacterium]